MLKSTHCGWAATRLAALEEEVAKNIYSIAARIEGMADKLAA